MKRMIKSALARKAVLATLALMISLSTLAAACSDDDDADSPADGSPTANTDAPAAESVSFTLETTLSDGGFAYAGVGGDFDGTLNPDLTVPVGATVEVTLQNGDGSEHNIEFEGMATSANISSRGASDTVTFTAEEQGTFSYYCTIPGHRAAGMEGTLTVGGGSDDQAATAVDISREPDDLPAPVGDRGPETVQVELEAVELEGQLDDGATYTYWTFNGQVPGPMVRARVNDTIELTLKNSPDSVNTHSIDLHAVTGPGGGAVATQVAPGDDAAFRFQALKPGLYVYHCATPSVSHHIAQGMYGMILIEPEGGLPPVDHEFYVMQGEIYTKHAAGSTGHQETDTGRIVQENPRYVVFNGSVGSLTERHPLTAEVGDSVRIYFGVGGPNFMSSFHVIGEIFDQVYDEASLTDEPSQDVQTTIVAPGGATVVEFAIEVPGRYILVDHALGRLERGAAGFLEAAGEDNPEIFFVPQE